jgi:hypothetical protein
MDWMDNGQTDNIDTPTHNRLLSNLAKHAIGTKNSSTSPEYESSKNE